ncbi:MAG: class I SAM-dependent methyltransferase [Candidatus Wenzhouxiangella sp. M2_3B_020]
MAERLDRTPEPELMDTPAQVRAYAGADFAESNQWFVDRLAEQLEAEAIAPGRLVDLGCGPGDICIRAARALPEWTIEGVDAGPNMLDFARDEVQRAGLADRIALTLARLPDPLDGRVYDCVISNSLLHHLPDPGVLWTGIARLAAPGAWIQVMDLERPDTRDEANALVERYAADEPEVLRADFRNSLHAAWRVDEVREQLREAGLQLECEPVSDRHWMVRGRTGSH